MTAEARRGKEFSKGQKRKAKKEAGGHCQACGGSLDAGKQHSHEGQVHHDPPIAKGGDRRSKAWVLDPECHRVADMLAIDKGVSLREIREKLGEKPLEPYKRNMRRGRWGKVVRRVTQRVQRVS